MGMRYLGMLGLELVWADHMQHTTHLALVPCTLGFHLNISPKIFKHLLLLKMSNKNSHGVLK